MFSHKEYLIRCKTCGEQIACFASDFEDLIKNGMSQEEALNEMGIYQWCSRIAFTNPSYIFHNMENREVIEGFKTVDMIDGPDPYNYSVIKPTFTTCLNKPITVDMKQTKQTKGFALAPEIKKITPEVEELKTNFEVPKIPGFSTINENPMMERVYQIVGQDKESEVLNGRTYKTF